MNQNINDLIFLYNNWIIYIWPSPSPHDSNYIHAVSFLVIKKYLVISFSFLRILVTRIFTYCILCQTTPKDFKYMVESTLQECTRTSISLRNFHESLCIHVYTRMYIHIISNPGSNVHIRLWDDGQLGYNCYGCFLMIII